MKYKQKNGHGTVGLPGVWANGHGTVGLPGVWVNGPGTAISMGVWANGHGIAILMGAWAKGHGTALTEVMENRHWKFQKVDLPNNFWSNHQHLLNVLLLLPLILNVQYSPSCPVEIS